MEKEFVPYEQSLALKELGFDEICFAHYCNGDLITKTAILKSSTMLYYQQNNINPNNQYKHQNCTTPLYQQAFRWFREKCGCEFHIECRRHTSVKYYEVFLFDGNKNSMIFGKSLKYEEAELECLKKLIEIIKK